MPTPITQAKGSSGQVILDFEVMGFNCINDAADRRPWNIPFNAVDLALSRPLNQAETIRGDRNPAPPFQGNKDVSGSLVVPVSFINSGLFFKACVGAPTTVDVPTSVGLGGTATIDASGAVVFATPQTGIALGDRVRFTYNDGSGTVVDGYITTRTDDSNMVVKADRAATTNLPGLPQSSPAATLTFGVTSKLAGSGVTVTITSGVATFSAAQAAAAVGDMVIYDGNLLGFVSSLNNPGTDTVFGIVDGEGFAPPDTGGAEPVEAIEANPKWKHTFKIHPINSLLSFTLARGFKDLSPQIWQFYTGCKVNNWSLEAGGDGELTMAMDLVGADEIGGNTPYDDSPAPTALTKALDRFEQFDATAKEGATLTAVNVLKTLTIDVTNDLDGDTYTIGGQGTRQALPEGIAGVSGSISALFVDDSILTKAQDNTTSGLELTFTSGTNVLVIRMPELKFQNNSPSIPGPAGVELNLEYQAFFSTNVDESAVVVELTNDQAAYAAA